MSRELKTCYAYVDGSFNAKTRIYAGGVVLVVDEAVVDISEWGDDKDMASMRNVAGEICGAMRAVIEAINLGYHEITIYYDYIGIEAWATSKWKTNKPCTIRYKEFMIDKAKLINIKFKKVLAHSGVEFNERADKLAKKACGVL